MKSQIAWLAFALVASNVALASSATHTTAFDIGGMRPPQLGVQDVGGMRPPQFGVQDIGGMRPPQFTVRGAQK